MLRPAKAEDHPIITEFLFRDFAQRHAILPPSERVIAAQVAQAIHDGRCAVYERNGDILGSTAIRSGGAWYSEGQAAFDIWINANSNPIVGGRLRQWLKEKADYAGLRLFIGVSGDNEESTEAARRLSKRHPLVSRTFEASAFV